MDVEQDEQDDFDKKASKLYLEYLLSIVEYIDDKKYNEKKLIQAFRSYLEETNLQCNPRRRNYRTRT